MAHTTICALMHTTSAPACAASDAMLAEAELPEHSAWEDHMQITRSLPACCIERL